MIEPRKKDAAEPQVVPWEEWRPLKAAVDYLGEGFLKAVEEQEAASRLEVVDDRGSAEPQAKSWKVKFRARLGKAMRSGTKMKISAEDYDIYSKVHTPGVDFDTWVRIDNSDMWDPAFEAWYEDVGFERYDEQRKPEIGYGIPVGKEISDLTRATVQFTYAGGSAHGHPMSVGKGKDKIFVTNSLKHLDLSVDTTNVTITVDDEEFVLEFVTAGDPEHGVVDSGDWAVWHCSELLKKYKALKSVEFDPEKPVYVMYQDGMIRSVVGRADGKLLAFAADSEAGDSGAPLFQFKGAWKIVGHHLGCVTGTTKRFGLLYGPVLFQ
jgi:hypothetical protein